MPEPILSIVTGTYNRGAFLERMMQSVRSNIPDSIPYEFVVVDGGSSDGTLKYLSQFTDVRIIAHGELKGAIKAFCDGARAAHGQYVLLANDDITFNDGSIIRALLHLESTPRCGAVAFADNRPAPGYGEGYKVQTISAIKNGQAVSVAYPQVGLIRRWLGDLCDWWGANDPLMSQGHTYGGDNYLGARIWEAGYTVDAVEGVTCEDHIPQDDLRRMNHAIEQRKPGMYYKRYGAPPIIRPEPIEVNPQSEQLRILYLPIFEPHNPAQRTNKHGLKKALQRYGLVYEVDYLNTAFDLSDLVKTFSPHLLLMQLHGNKEITPTILADARRLKPDMVVVNWNGDARDLDKSDYLDLLRLVDLQLVVNAMPLERYEKEGIAAAYWQIGYEEPLNDLPSVTKHDVIFLANCYSPERKQLEKILLNTGLNIGLYGFGWKRPAGNTLYDFAKGEALYQNAVIAVGDTFPKTTAFVSNRVFQALGAGAFLLQQHSNSLAGYTGLENNQHYIEWTTPTDLVTKIHFWMQPKHAEHRRQIADCGQAFVRANYSFDAQVRKLFSELLPMIKERSYVVA